MIELPEASVIAGQVTETLGGKRITRAVAGASPHKFAWYTGDPANYQNLLAGKTIRDAVAYGNHVEIHVDDLLLVISTPIKYHAAGERVPQKHQLYLEFDDGSAMSCTVQMWGAMLCFREGEESGLSDQYLARHRPSPLSAAFDRSCFDALTRVPVSSRIDVQGRGEVVSSVRELWLASYLLERLPFCCSCSMRSSARFFLALRVLRLRTSSGTVYRSAMRARASAAVTAVPSTSRSS